MAEAITKVIVVFYVLTYLHRVPTRSLQRSLSWAIFAASPQVRPILSLNSFSADRHHVSLGCPHLRLHVGVQYKASLVMLPAGFLKTWPIQLHLLLPTGRHGVFLIAPVPNAFVINYHRPSYP